MFHGHHRRHKNEFVKKPFPVDYASVEWDDVNESDGHLPENAFMGCILETGEKAFVAKAKVESQDVTGFTTETGLRASLPYNCTEHTLSSFQVLTTEHPETLYWIKSSRGIVPKSAVEGGNNKGELMHVGRTCTPLQDGQSFYRHVLTLNRHCTDGTRLGKIHPSHHRLYIPFNGTEFYFPTYEVLCRKESPTNLAAICKWYICKYLVEIKKNKTAIDQLPIPSPLKQYLTR